MIHAYVPRERVVERIEVPAGGPVPDGTIWFDLYAPTDEERRGIERTLSLDLPTRDHMLEIEPSSRLRVEHDAV
jgi:magnesium transporter